MIRALLLLGLLAGPAMAQTKQWTTNDITTPDGPALALARGDTLRLTVSSTDGLTSPYSLVNKTVWWHITDAYDAHPLTNVQATVLDATGGVSRAIYTWPLNGTWNANLHAYNSDGSLAAALSRNFVTVYNPTTLVYQITNSFIINGVAVQVTNLIEVNVGSVTVSNTVINIISNRMDATVTIPGLTVDVSGITIDAANLIAVGQPAGAIPVAQGDGTIAMSTSIPSMTVYYDDTNLLGTATDFAAGDGLRGTLTNGTFRIDLVGGEFPYSGVTITNIQYFFAAGETGQWHQVSAGVSNVAYGMWGPGGALPGTASSAGGWRGGTFPVEPFEWLYVEVGYAGTAITNTSGSVMTPMWTASSWPGGGRGATRNGSNAVARGSGAYCAIWRGLPDKVTGTNLIAIVAGGSSSGINNGNTIIGGAGGGETGGDGQSVGSGAIGGFGASRTNNGALALASWTGLALTGSPPAFLRGGDAQISTNYQGSSSGGSPGIFSGSGGGAEFSGNLSAGAAGGGGSSGGNPAMGEVGTTIRGIGATVPKKEDPRYIAAGGTYGDAGYNGLVWIAEVVGP